MAVENLTKSVNSFTLFVCQIKEKITSPNPGIFDGLIADIKAFIEGMINKIKDGLSGVLGGIEDRLKGILKGIEDKLSGIFTAVKIALSTVITDLTTGLSGLVTKVKEGLEGFVTTLKNKLSDMIESVGETVGLLVEKVKALIERLTDKLEEIVRTILQRVGEFFDGVITKIRETIQNIVDTLRDIVSTFRDAVSKYVDNVITGVREAINAFTEGVRAAINAIKTTLEEYGSAVIELAQRIWAGVETIIRNVSQTVSEAYNAATEKIKTVIQTLLARIADAFDSVVESFWTLWISVVLPFIQEAGTIKDETWRGLQYRFQGVKEVIKGTFGSDINLIQSGLEKITEIKDVKDLTTLLIVGQFLVAVLPSVFVAYAEPALKLVRQQINANLPVSLIAEEVGVPAVYRGLWSYNEYQAEMAKAGYSPQKAQIMLEAKRPLPSPGAIQEAYLRGIINEAEHDGELLKHGYTWDDINLFKALYRIIPPPNDLIRMAVREAFTPEIAAKFGQYEDLPNAFVEWASKQGLSKEWAERYWAAHWDLPSPTMGFEMLHRGIITPEELKLLLRALDVMPFWREKLIKLSYVPYTRVDIRRMYQVGVLDAEGVKRAYKDLGYDDEKAARLTEFTIKYYGADEETEVDETRQLTRTVYINAYKKNVISRNEAKDYLVGIGYTDADAELLLSIADAEKYVQQTVEDPLPKRAHTLTLITNAYKRGLYNREEAFEAIRSLDYSVNDANYYLNLADYELELGVKTEYMDTVKELYVSRTIEKTEVYSYLSSLALSAKEMNNLLTLWDIGRELRVRKPTEAQFRYALQKGLITKEEYENELRGLGYAEKYVSLLSAMATR